MLNLSIDNYGGGYLVGCHFRELGHRELLCVSDNETGIDRARIEGFRHGAAPGAAQLLLVPMQKEERWAYYRQQLERLRRATAVFAVSDFYALDLMCFLSEHGLAVPDDISVAGFDDTPMCELVRPALTTVRQDAVLRAKLAVEKLRNFGRGSRCSRSIRCLSPLSCAAAQGRAACQNTQFCRHNFVIRYALNL